jgi:hypothetical protein
MKERIVYAFGMILVGHIIAMFLMAASLVKNGFPPLHVNVLIASGVIIPAFFYLLWGRKAIIVGVLVAIAYNVLDIIYIKERFFPETLTQADAHAANYIAVAPINIIFLIIGIIMLFKSDSED